MGIGAKEPLFAQAINSWDIIKRRGILFTITHNSSTSTTKLDKETNNV